MTSTIKVNNVQNQCGQNIINENSNTITIGASGDTIALASGASQSGFGRTGTVDWQTGSIKTATFTAANGEGYFCNTTSGSFEVDLPAGSAGAIVSIQDYNNTFDNNNLTVDPNGSEKINGGAAGAAVTLSTEGLGVTFVYIDATVGWRSIHSNEYATAGEGFVVATGGNTITEDGDFKVHTFTGPGTFTVCSLASTPANNVVQYLVVAGGGGGGCAGGGAGGFRTFTASPLSTPPLNAPAGITVTATGFPIAVGGGGAATGTGSVSTFSTITSAGGGRSVGNTPPEGNGGSGGGGRGSYNPNSAAGGAGNQPPVSPSQGNPGGAGSGPATGGGPGCYQAGGGGGANSDGRDFNQPSPGNGGDGEPSNITGSPVVYAGGGSTSTGGQPSPRPGGAGGGGTGSQSGPATTAGTVNTGGGGGGGTSAKGGGSGVVIIRYKYK